MQNFTLHTVDSAPEGSKAALEGVSRAWGFTPKMHATLAESPSALNGYEALWTLLGHSSLTPAEQQVVCQAVNVLHRCGYCTMGHTYLSRQAGLDEPTVTRLRAGQEPQDRKLAALWTFVRHVVKSRGEAADAVPAFIAAGYSKANVLDVVTIVAAKTIANYSAALTNIPAEDFMSDPALAWTPLMIAAE